MHASVPVITATTSVARVPNLASIAGGLITNVEVGKEDLSQVFHSLMDIFAGQCRDVRLSNAVDSQRHQRPCDIGITFQHALESSHGLQCNFDLMQNLPLPGGQHSTLDLL